jgi:hypothetical protein
MTSNKEYIGRTTFTIFYSEYDKGVVDGVKQITFKSMELPISIEDSYYNFFKEKDIPTSEEIRGFLNK